MARIHHHVFTKPLYILGLVAAVWAFVAPTSTIYAALQPPSITKAFTPSTIPANTISSLSFTLTNPNAATALTGVSVTDGLPSGVVVASPANVVNTCGGTVAAPVGSGLVSLSSGTIAPNSTCTITLDVTSGTIGTYNNTSGNVTSTNGGVGNTASAPLVVTPPIQPPSIAKSFTPATMALGGTSTLSLTITNPAGNPVTLTGVSVTDNLPAGITVANPPNATGNCNGGVFAPAATDTSLTLTGGTIVSNTNCVLTVSVTAATQGAYVNTTGNVNSANGGAGNTATSTLTVVAPPILAKAFNPTSVAAGGTSQLTLTITNPAGNTVAETGLSLTDNLPAGLVIAAPNGLANTCGGAAAALAGSASVSLTGGTLAVNATCTVKVNVTSPNGGTYVNTTQASATNGGASNPATDTLTITGTIQPPAIAKAFGPATINAGDISTITFTITNPAGNVFPLTGLAFTDPLPAGLVIALPPGTTNTCGGAVTANGGGNQIRLANGSVAVNGTCTITVNVTSPTGATYVNTTSPIRSINGGTGNTGSDSLTVTGNVNAPAIAKAFNPATIPAGGTSTLTLTIDNSNATTTLTGVAVTDNLPAGVLIAAPPNQVGNCGGGTITAVTGGPVFRLVGGTIPPASNCAISVNVTSAAAGGHVNTTGTVSSNNGGTGNTATDTLTVTGTVNPPDITKSFGTPVIMVGGVSTLTFTITNSNATVDLTGVKVADTLPAGVRVATPNGLVGNCNGGIVTATAGSGTFNLNGGTIPANSNCVITINVTGTSAGVKNNQTGIVSSTNAGSGNQATDTMTVIGPPTITKAFTPSTIQAGGTSTLTFTITNPFANPAAATGVAFSDTLPALVVFATPPNLVGNCNGGTVTLTGGNTIVLTGGSIPLNNNCMISVDVFGPNVGVYPNTTGNVSSTNGGVGGTANATLTVTGAILPPTITKSFTPATILAGTITKITFTIINPAANAVPELGVAVTDNLPAGLIVAAAPNIIGNCNGGTVTATAGSTVISLTGGTIPAHANCVFSVDATSALGGVYANTTGPASSTNGGTGGTGSATLVVVAPPTIAKSFAPNPIIVGGTSTLSLTITNSNLGTLITGIAVSDTLPTGMLIATPPNVVGNCNGGTVTANAGGNTISLAAGDLPASASCIITVDVTASQVGVLTNTTGSVTSTNGGTGTPATTTLTVNPTIQPPSIAKAFAPTSIALNGVSTLTFTITNPNPVATLNGVAVTDNLPAGLVVAAAPNVVGNCNGGTVTATAGSGTITVAGGTLTAGANCIISVDVTGTAPGLDNNTTQPVTSTNGGTGNTASAVIAVGITIQPPNIIKSFAPTSIALNGTSTMTFVINNPNPGVVLTGVAVTDTLPAGLLVATPPTPVGTCNGGTVTAVAASNSVSLAGGTLGAGANCTITVHVTGTTVGLHDNTTGNVTSTNGGTGNTGSATLAVGVAIQPPRIVKSFVPTSIPVNGTSTMTFVISNPNATTALAGVAVSDTLPGIVVFATPPTVVGNCNGGTVTLTGGNNISLTGGTLAAHASCTITVHVTGNTAGLYNNTTGNVTSTNGGTGNTGSAVLAIGTSLLPPSIAKSFSPSSIPVGGTSTLTLIITNPNAGLALMGVAVTDNFPPGLTVATTPNVTNSCVGTITGGTAAANNIGLTGGGIPAGGNCTITVSVVGTNSGTNTTGNVSSTNAGTGNTASANITVGNTSPAGGSSGGSFGSGGSPNVGVADPAIAKGVDPSLAQPGAAVTYTITVTNKGTAPALNVVVVDPVPSVVVVTGANATQGTFSISGNTVTFNVGTVNPNQVITLHVLGNVSPNVQPPVDLTNTAQMGNLNASALLHIAKGYLPSTGEHPDDAQPPSIPIGALIGVVIMLIAIMGVRRLA